MIEFIDDQFNHGSQLASRSVFVAAKDRLLALHEFGDSYMLMTTKNGYEPQKIWMSEKALHMLYGALDEFFNRPPEMGVAATFNVNEDYFEGNFAIPMEQRKRL